MFGFGSTTRTEPRADATVGNGYTKGVESGCEGERVERRVDGLSQPCVEAGQWGKGRS